MDLPMRRRRHTEEGESYFMSMTDMMVGLLLIFIILLAYFALQLQTKTAELTGSNAARQEMLEDMQRDLEKRGLKVTIDVNTGVLRLPDDLLFAKGSATISNEGLIAVEKIAQSMVSTMPKYSFISNLCDQHQELDAYKPTINAVFVEGHTDSDIMLGPISNYDLSVLRAVSTFKALRAANPLLDKLLNSCDGQRILSLSGYGPDRPVARGNDEVAKTKNRRIDLRILMNTPVTDKERNMLVNQ